MSYELQRCLAFIGTFLNLFLALLALTHTRRNPLYRSFFIMTAVLFLWNFSHYSYRSTGAFEVAYPVSFQCSLALIPSMLLHFICRLTAWKRSRIPLRMAYGVGIAWCAVFMFTGLIYSATWFFIFGAMLIAVVLYGISVLVRSLKQTPPGIQKNCEKAVLMGLLAFLVLGVIDYLCIVYIQTYSFLSILGGLIFSTSVAWAVFTYHLLDLKDSLHRALWTAAVLIGIYLLYLGISGLFEDFPGMRPLALVVSVLGVAFLLSPLGPRRIREVIHGLFFPDKVTLVDVINRFVSEAEKIRSTDILISAYLKNVTAGLPIYSGVLCLKGKNGLAVSGYTGGGDPIVLDSEHLGEISKQFEGWHGFLPLSGRFPDLPGELFTLVMDRNSTKGVFILKAPGRGRGPSYEEKQFLEIITAAFSSAFSRIREGEEKLPAPGVRIEQFGGIVGGSAPMIEIYSTIRKIAPSDATVLVQGESGTGKELVAEMIHNLSGRSGAPFVAINCATLTGDLLKSELFGHERGSFTGAVAMRTGRFEQAHGGTLFLDEIGEIPLPTQAMLLRVIENKEITRLGGRDSIRVDVRIVVATNKELAREVREGSFREDLFYRLNVLHISVPPLRDRKEDIPLLVDYFIKQYSEEFSKNVRGITRAGLKLLTDHDWPGNIRELSNLIERAVVMTSSDMLAPEDIALEKTHAEGL